METVETLIKELQKLPKDLAIVVRREHVFNSWIESITVLNEQEVYEDDRDWRTPKGNDDLAVFDIY